MWWVFYNNRFPISSSPGPRSSHLHDLHKDSFPGNGSGSKPVVYTKVAMLSRDEIPPGVCRHSTSKCRSLTFLQATDVQSDAPNVNYDSGTTLDDVERDAHAILVFVSPLQLISYVCLTDSLERPVFYRWSSRRSSPKATTCGLPNQTSASTSFGL